MFRNRQAAPAAVTVFLTLFCSGALAQTAVPAGESDGVVNAGSPPERRLTFTRSSASSAAFRTSTDATTDVEFVSANAAVFRLGTGTPPPERMRITPYGNVGIGTPSPATLLHVSGAASNVSAYLTIDRPSSSLDAAVLFRTANSGSEQWAVGQKGGSHAMLFGYPDLGNVNVRMALTTDGKLGVGTHAPGSPLDVMGPALTYQYHPPLRAVMRLIDTAPMALGVGAGIDFVGRFMSNGTFNTSGNVKVTKLTAVDADPTTQFIVSVVNQGGLMDEPLRVRGGNNSGVPQVIIGPDIATAASDTNRLVVNGNMKVVGVLSGGSLQAQYQDVAEWVPATHDLEPGTVVVLNEIRDNEVTASSTAYDTRVAGVVSAQPGLILGIGGEGQEQIATTGRVRVRVDATSHPIAIGDLLVTSDKSGMAMKSEPMDIQGRHFHQPGTIVGKALQPLASGTGEILVLLSLQ
jgi:hypothetical protein